MENDNVIFLFRDRITGATFLANSAEAVVDEICNDFILVLTYVERQIHPEVLTAAIETAVTIAEQTEDGLHYFEDYDFEVAIVDDKYV